MTKKNFLLPTSARESVDALSDEDAGRLLKALYSYADTGEYELEGPLVAFFIQLRQGIDKNEATYQSRVKNLEKNVENAEKNKDTKSTKDDCNSNLSEIEPISERNENNHNESEMASEQHQVKIDSDARHNTYNINNLDNITELSNTNNLKERNNKRKKSPDKSPDESSDKSSDESPGNGQKNIYEQIIDHLNECAETNFRSSSKATRKLIDARVNEKYSLTQFLKVIDNKVLEWKGTKMEVFLRPSTLFGNKFDEYFNQKVNIPSNNQERQQHKTVAKVPNWVNKKIKAEEVSPEELKELDELFSATKDPKQIQIDDAGELVEGELPF